MYKSGIGSGSMQESKQASKLIQLNSMLVNGFDIHYTLYMQRRVRGKEGDVEGGRG